MSFDMLVMIVIGAIAICYYICECITSVAIAKTKSHKNNIEEEDKR